MAVYLKCGLDVRGVRVVDSFVREGTSSLYRSPAFSNVSRKVSVGDFSVGLMLVGKVSNASILIVTSSWLKLCECSVN